MSDACHISGGPARAGRRPTHWRASPRSRTGFVLARFSSVCDIAPCRPREDPHQTVRDLPREYL